MLKSIDVTNAPISNTTIDKTLKNLTKDLCDKVQTLKVDMTQKTYHLSQKFSTPRTPTGSLKAAFHQNMKMFNSRRSQDIAYIYSKNRRNTEASLTSKNVKNHTVEISDIQSSIPKIYLK